MASLVHQGLLVLLELQASLVLLVVLDFPEELENLASLDNLVGMASQDPQDHKVELVYLELVDVMDSLVVWVQLVPQALLAIPVEKVYQAHQDHLVKPEEAHQAQMVCRVQMDHQDQPVQEAQAR